MLGSLGMSKEEPFAQHRAATELAIPHQVALVTLSDKGRQLDDMHDKFGTRALCGIL